MNSTLGGFHLAFGVVAGLAAAAIAIAVTVLEPAAVTAGEEEADESAALEPAYAEAA